MVSGNNNYFSINWDKNKKRKIMYRNIHPVHVGSIAHRTHTLAKTEAYGGLAPFDTGNAFQDMWASANLGGKILLYQDGGSGTSIGATSYNVETATISPRYAEGFSRCVKDLGFGERYDIEFEINVDGYEVNY